MAASLTGLLAHLPYILWGNVLFGFATLKLVCLPYFGTFTEPSISFTRDSWSFLTLFAKLTTSVCIPAFKIIKKWFQMHGPRVDSIHDPTLNPADPEI